MSVSSKQPLSFLLQVALLPSIKHCFDCWSMHNYLLNPSSTKMVSIFIHLNNTPVHSYANLPTVLGSYSSWVWIPAINNYLSWVTNQCYIIPSCYIISAPAYQRHIFGLTISLLHADLQPIGFKRSLPQDHLPIHYHTGKAASSNVTSLVLKLRFSSKSYYESLNICKTCADLYFVANRKIRSRSLIMASCILCIHQGVPWCLNLQPFQTVSADLWS